MRKLYTPLYLLSLMALPAMAQTAPRISPLLQQQVREVRTTRTAAEATLPAFIHITDDSAVEQLDRKSVV